MSGSPVVRYVASSVAAALAGLAVALPLAWPRGVEAMLHAVAGWAVMVAIASVGGAWLLARHGRAGSAFLVAMGVCMLARLGAFGLAAMVDATRGREAVWPFVGGLVAGFVPTKAFEAAWFGRQVLRESRGFGRAPGLCPERGKG